MQTYFALGWIMWKKKVSNSVNESMNYDDNLYIEFLKESKENDAEFKQAKLLLRNTQSQDVDGNSLLLENHTS